MEHGRVVSRAAGHVDDALDPGLLEPVAIERLFGRQALRPVDHRLVDVGQLIEGVSLHEQPTSFLPGSYFFSAEFREFRVIGRRLRLVALFVMKYGPLQVY